ncbi:MAG: hypothetical protein IV108_02265 [Burkholderiales bacterium]|nr:hypothetical protein [Burkholderiales bacterium]
MRFLSFLILACASLPASALEVTICYNYGCAVQAKIAVDLDDLTQLDQLFEDVGNAAVERGSIQLAIGFMNRVAGKQTPIRNDKGGNYKDDGVEGRMDCIDHSHTTTAYLKLIEARGLLSFHRVLEPVRRAPLLVNDHWSARIQESESGEQYAVDSWFFDNGEPAAIFPIREWLKGAEPHV